MTDAASFNELQFRQVLAAINALHNDKWSHWLQVGSVFMSALLAFLIGIGLERYKSRQAATDERRKQEEREIRQINAVIAGIAFNIETLVHIAAQNILPHYKDSHLAYEALAATKDNPDMIAKFFVSMDRYNALWMTCPDLKFLEFDFWKELPFIIERDAEVLKKSGWLISFANELRDLVMRRNRHIDTVANLITQQGGKLNFYALQGTLQRNASVADSECVVASQLSQVLVGMGKDLERINDRKQGKKLTLPKEALDTIDELRGIADKITPNMPT